MINTVYPEVQESIIKQSYITNLECSGCSTKYPASVVQNTCIHENCQETLLARYSFNSNLTKEKLRSRPFTMWRYKEFMPVTDSRNIVSLGEGGTPLFHAKELAKAVNIQELYWKDEGGNPTGSFKARGMSAAISKAKELGITTVVFDRGGYIYHGRVKAVAEGAREGGLVF